ncbi:eCIS core domain-containing protein [Streptomyces sp. NPDC001858]
MRSQDQSKDSSVRGAVAARAARTPGSAVPPQHALATRSPEAIRALQRSAGNAVMARLVAQRSAGQDPDTVQRAADSVQSVIRSAGAPLNSAVRQDMEARLGADFGDVRLHTDAAARQSAAAVGARAYTSGSHVVIGDGGGDRHTLAHELTHVIQQRQGPVAGTDHGDGLRVSDPSDRYERAAEDNARRALSGSAPTPAPAPAPAPGHTNTHATAPGVQRAPSPGAKLGTTPGAAPGATPTVQRARTGGIDGVGALDATYFTTQSPEGVLAKGTSPNGLINAHVDHMGVETHHPAGVALRYSDDGTLAVHDTDREPKEFYATTAVFQQAVNQLAQAGSQYTLVQGAEQIKTPIGNLTKVTPVTANTATQQMAGGFADLIKVQCIDVARKVVGSYQMQLVMAGNGADARAPWGQNVGVPLADHLTKSVGFGGTTSGTTAAAAAATADGQGGRSERDVARDYGSTLRDHPAQADAVALKMGINRHAMPEVGEGFATLSIGHGDKIDFATAAPGQDSTDRSHVDVWNYHFAGVVARSLTGADWVTLENYTRNQNAQNALKDLESKLLDTYREKTKSFFNSYTPQEPKSTMESERIIEMLQKIAHTTRAKAMAEYMALGIDQTAWKGKWFFRLYGSQPGETFHDKQYAGGSGDFVNPLTVRVRNST